MIVTRDVYRFLSEHAGVTFDVRNTDHGIYRGYRIGIVNEQGYSDILKPAMLRRQASKVIQKRKKSMKI